MDPFWSHLEFWDRTGNPVAPAITIFLVLIAPAILSLSLLLRRGRKTQSQRYPVAPGKLPFLGHALSLADSDKFVAVLEEWAERIREDDNNHTSGIYEFSLLGTRYVVLCSADAIMQVVMRERPYKLRRSSKLTEAISSLGFRGLFNAEGDHWKKDRRLVAPALNKNHIDDYFRFIKLVAGRLMAKWDDAVKERGAVVTAFTDLSKYSLDIAALIILGMDFGSLNNPDNKQARDIQDLLRISFVRTLSPVPYWKIPFCGNLDRGQETSKRIIDTLTNLVRDYRKQKEDGGNSDNETHQQARERGTLLEKLVDVSSRDDAKLEEDRVVGNLATMIFAGTDTTSTTLAACLWEIANDEKLQCELYKEISDSGIDINSMTLSDVMNRLQRLHSLLFEVLRVKGPAPSLFLEPGEDIDFRGGVLNPGTMVCLMTQSLGEKAASEVPTGPMGEGAEQFCPQRWLTVSPNNSEKDDECLTLIQPSNKFGGFMAFGYGARVCPGAQLSKVEVVTGLFCILQRFEVAPIDNHPPIHRVTGVTQTFDSEIQLTLKPRT